MGTRRYRRCGALRTAQRSAKRQLRLLVGDIQGAHPGTAPAAKRAAASRSPAVRRDSANRVAAATCVVATRSADYARHRAAARRAQRTRSTRGTPAPRHRRHRQHPEL